MVCHHQFNVYRVSDRWATCCKSKKEQYCVRVMVCHRQHEIYRVLERYGAGSLSPCKQRIDRNGHWWVLMTGVLAITEDEGGSRYNVMMLWLHMGSKLSLLDSAG